MKDRISVVQKGASDPMAFNVTVQGNGTSTEHVVTMAKRHIEGLTSGRYDALQLIEAAFLFLLEREPKEAILRRFDLAIIESYFPEFQAQLPRYLSRVVSSADMRGKKPWMPREDSNLD